jgi:putative inorganic carbon (HCO3(-)) transporter
LEPWLLLAALPFLMFPQRFTALLLPLLALPWLARKRTQGRFTARTPMDGPILVLLLMLPIALWVSVDVQRSLLKFYGIILGFAVFYGLVNHVRRPAQAWMVGLGLALAGLAVSALALLGANWRGGKLFALPQLYGRLPRLVSGVPGSPPGGFNPNEVGAALCLFIPFVASWLFLGFPQSQTAGTVQPMPDHALIPAGARRWVLFGLLALVLLVMAGTLALTQSRSAYLGISVALVVLASFRRRWLWLALLLAVLVGAVAWRYLGTERILSSFQALGSERNIGARLEIWQRALYMIQDFPYTGVGLNTFPLVASTLYPLFSLAPERVLQLTHAHNAFLQVAADLGIPGLVGYVALLLGFGAAWWTAYRRFAPGPLRALSVGLLCAIVAHHVYGLTDCITLGAKPGVAIWAMLGLMAALANLPQETRS